MMQMEGTANSTTADPRLPAPAPPYSEASIIGQTCFSILIIVAAFLGNCLVVGAVLGSKKLRKSTNYFIVSLALSDILIALTVMTIHVHHYLNSMKWNLGPGVCKMWLFMDLLCSTASITNVALISIDRFLALTYPFKYSRIVNRRRCLVAIVTIWSYSAILSSLSFKNWSEDATFEHKPACAKNDSTYYLFSTILGIFFPLVILVVAYSLVFRLALRQAIAIKALSTPQIPKHQEQRTAGDVKRKPSENIMKNRLLIRELKATKTLLIVVGTFLVCWFPLFVLILVQQYCLKCIKERLSFTWQQIIGMTFVYILPRLNSAVNPIIYSIFNRDFRSVFCTFGDKVVNVLPRVGAICASHGRSSFVCRGTRGEREAGKRSRTSHNSAYESNTEYFGFSYPNELGTSASATAVFAFQNIETYYYESSV